VALDTLEDRLGVKLPEPLRRYLEVVDGMESGAWVGPPIDFWTMRRIETEAHDWGCFDPRCDATLLPFADLLLHSHAYAILVSSAAAPVFIVHGLGLEPRPCARSFDVFIDLYLLDDDALY
jgi:hypothetical protein